jgi:uncharacterized protein (DUF302 family)
MKSLLVALALAIAIAPCAMAQSGLVTLPSKYSVADTASWLEAAVESEPGFLIFGRIAYHDIAASQGVKVRPSQLLLFGRGRAVQHLLSAAPTLGIDLPLKALVWEDENGKVWVSHNTAEFLRDRHSAQGVDNLLKQLTDRTASFVKKAIE